MSCNSCVYRNPEGCGEMLCTKQLAEHDEKLKAEIIETMADIVRAFAKTWNMEQSSRIPYIARDELISELRMAIKKVK